ncbi:MAG: DUF2029 domain-containing protein [Microscillaceae bacterium]|jgi:hypothetical protein|nr:DUF2029 domain-containing protein [Microscillaceae bacterium]
MLQIVQFFHRPIFADFRFILGIYLVLILFIGIKEVYFTTPAPGWALVDNYALFYRAYYHLIENQTLYGFFPAEYHSRYNYGPVFAALMFPFAQLPYGISAILWNLAIGWIFYSAIRHLPLHRLQIVFVFWICLNEAYTAFLNFQTNPAVAAAIIWTFIFWERKQPFWAAAVLMLGFWVKIYVILAGFFFFFYPQKIKFILYCVFWSLVWLALPLFFVSFKQLIFLYQDWVHWLGFHNDKHFATNFMALVGSWLGSPDSKLNPYFILTGGFLLLGVLLKLKYYQDLIFKQLVLANVLIFAVIFNPASESPTYVIAFVGVALWYILSPYQIWRLALLIFAFVLTSLSPTDIFPPDIRNQILIPYRLKALPCVVIWLVSLVELYRYRLNLQKTDEVLLGAGI